MLDSSLTDCLVTNFRWGFTGELQDMSVKSGRVEWRRPGGAPTTRATRDMNGVWLMPAFVDAHCHILPTGLDLLKLNLGHCETREDVLDVVRSALDSVREGKWLHAVHYDHNKFPDGRHLTRHELDKISSDVPILLRHVSGHSSVANTAAMMRAGVSKESVDPPGGSFGRDESGDLDGVLYENAHEHVTNAAPKVTPEEMVDAILAAGDKMASLGIGCASDMMTGRFDLAQELNAYRIASEQGCKIRMRLYLQWATVFGPRAIDAAKLRALKDAMRPELCRVAGVKIFADGAIGSATAAIYGRYTGAPINRQMILTSRGQSAREIAGAEIDGQLIYEPDKLKEMVRIAHDAGYQIAIHSIGDYSTDLVLDAYEALGDASRHRIEHAMILSDHQIERFAKVGCHCTMQPEFLMRFGKTYRAQLGPEKAARLKRARSVIGAGIRLSFNSDRPIVGGDPLDGIRTAANRPEHYDPMENVQPEEALLAYTAWAARSNEDADMGSLEPGQLADIQILESDPRELARSEAVGAHR